MASSRTYAASGRQHQREDHHPPRQHPSRGAFVKSSEAEAAGAATGGRSADAQERGGNYKLTTALHLAQSRGKRRPERSSTSSSATPNRQHHRHPQSQENMPPPPSRSSSSSTSTHYYDAHSSPPRSDTSWDMLDDDFSKELAEGWVDLGLPNATGGDEGIVRIQQRKSVALLREDEGFVAMNLGLAREFFFKLFGGLQSNANSSFAPI